ncbi:siderophore ABC transporter substrate-binding protein [Pseudomonas asiatica]|uniref:siderophore ABC transporter substrate-binding protein n=1 Tax=Pseudomonas asiatica TaxID=2219225 RepID=UPI002570F43A|nr:siderophore ABC transporter substrate-binding protein [Pseudomonas asiatica]WJD72270.1 siderophore ABC transporter substrate-binding protein [Pseudomonas asiatica]
MTSFPFARALCAVFMLLKLGTAHAETPASAPLQIEHAQGTATVAHTPVRVVVFDLAALDDLDALGVEVTGVPDETMPSYLSRYAEPRYARVGTLFEPDYEALNRVKPDLIITGGRSSAKYAQLAKIAPTIDMREDHSQPIATALSNLDMLAKVFGKQQQAQSLKGKLDNDLHNVRADAANRGNALIVLVTGGRISAYGTGSRFGLLHDALQIPPALPTLKPSLHGEAISPELILKANPDWLFVIDRDAAIGKHGAAHQVLDNPLVQRTHAWRNNQVVYLDPVNWYLVGTGIQSVKNMMLQLDEAFDAPR